MATDDEVTETPTRDERGARTLRTTPGRLGTRAEERYTFVDEIGRGGMGDVYAARDEELGREVAIKRLRADAPTERQIARFLREARIQGRLDHPAIVPVHELGYDPSGLPFFAMKRLAGTTLAATLRGPQLPLARLLRAFADLCLAVEFAHVRGVIHRDLKPDNIVLGDYGDVYVLDWGVAKVAGEADDFSDLRSDGVHTQTGVVIGTPSYMAPEQARDSASIDARADVFALGRILGEILETERDAPPELLAIRDAALAADPDHRTPSARALGDHVQGYLDGDRDLALRRKLARDHLEHARAAFSSDLDVRDRGVAIRAASSALALDPTLAGAAELVGRLMLEPPRETPPEVAQSLLADDTAWVYAQRRAALRTTMMLLFVVVPPFALFGALRAALAFGAFALVNSAAIAINLRRKPFVPTPVVLTGALNALAVAVLAHIFSPMIVAPVTAALIATTLGMNPFIRTRFGLLWLGAALFAGVMIPALGEHAGLLAPTMEAVPGGLLFHGAIRPAAWMVLPLTALLAGSTIAAGLLIAYVVARQDRRIRTHLHLQAWQLRQLVNDPLAAT